MNLLQYLAETFLQLVYAAPPETQVLHCLCDLHGGVRGDDLLTGGAPPVRGVGQRVCGKAVTRAAHCRAPDGAGEGAELGGVLAAHALAAEVLALPGCRV